MRSKNQETQRDGLSKGPEPVSTRHGCYKKHLVNGQMWKVAECFLKWKLEGGVHSCQWVSSWAEAGARLGFCRGAGKQPQGWGAVRELITKNVMRCRSHYRGAGNAFKKDANPGEELLLAELGVGVRKPV